MRRSLSSYWPKEKGYCGLSRRGKHNRRCYGYAFTVYNVALAWRLLCFLPDDRIDFEAIINKSKAANAGIILADGPALVGNASFKETSGLFGKEIRRVKKNRAKKLREAAQAAKAKTAATLHADSVAIGVDDAKQHNAATMLSVQESSVQAVAAKKNDPKHNAEKSSPESDSIKENDPNASASLPIQSESSAKTASATNQDIHPFPDSVASLLSIEVPEAGKSPTPDLTASMVVNSSGDDDSCLVVVDGGTIEEDQCTVVHSSGAAKKEGEQPPIPDQNCANGEKETVIDLYSSDDDGGTVEEDQCTVVDSSGVVKKEGEQPPLPDQNRANEEKEKKAEPAVIDLCSSDDDDE